MNRQTVSTVKGDILIVDDKPDNLRLLSTMLQSQGYQVRKAINGQLALQGAQMAKPDLILLDINMPQMNGYEVCERLKSSEQTSDIPVIFISALDEALDKVKAFNSGGVDYITKPFQVEEVLARVENQLTTSKLQQQLAEKNLKLQQQAWQLNEQNELLQQQVKERQKAEVEIRLLLATTQAIGRSQDIHSALEVILRLVCRTIGWDFGEAWIPSHDATVLECSRGWYASELLLSKFRNQSLKVVFTPNIGMPGRVLSSKQYEWLEDVSKAQPPAFLRQQIAANAGLKACFGVPIIVNDEVLAVLIFFKKVSKKEDPRLVELVKAVATQLGSLIQRKQTEEALRLAEQRYHNIVENAVDGFFQSTDSGEYISANAALAKLYSYDSPEELILSFKDVSRQLYVDPNRRQEFVEALEADDTISGFESLVYRKDGSTIWIAENARAVRDKKGKLLYYEGTVYNITARKQVQEALQFQQEQTEELLLNILPAPIAQRLKQEHQIIADSFEIASVLFADIVGFTEFSSRKSPTELVKVLNVVFSKFDQLAERHGLEKIKTIGDAYMVVGGLPIPKENHAEAIAAMALDMQAEMASVNAKIKENFKIRIGINTGPVVAGVIGISKFIYDLWGDTVNVASRMESTGIPGRIQVTDATYERLKDNFILEKRGPIPIKGKGDMMTYLLLGYK